jgi:catalase
MSNGKKLTTNAGGPVVDNQNVLTAGRRGPQRLDVKETA